VVVSVPEIGRLPLRIVVPVTDWKPAYNGLPWFVRLPVTPHNGLIKDSGADAFRVKSVALSRCVAKLGILAAGELNAIVTAIALCIGMTVTPSS
jgi:mRNA interferase MazF